MLTCLADFFFIKGPDLEKALDESDKLFQGAGARPTARKVLVVIMDKKSGVAESRVNSTANRLYEHYIDVIPVAVGEEADLKQLKLTTKDQSNLIEAPKVFVPDKLGEAIMRKVLKGIFPLLVSKIRVLHTSMRDPDFPCFRFSMCPKKKTTQNDGSLVYCFRDGLDYCLYFDT